MNKQDAELNKLRITNILTINDKGWSQSFQYCMYLFYGLFIMPEIIYLSFGPLAELLEDLSPPGCRLGWGDRLTHGLNRLDQSWKGKVTKIG